MFLKGKNFAWGLKASRVLAMSIFLFSFDSFSFSTFWDDFVCVLAGLVQLSWWSCRVRLSFSFNCLNCISGLVLLCFFYFVVAIFVTTIWRHNHFKSAFCSFVQAISTELHVWRHFLLLVELVFLFAWLNFWSHVTYVTLKNDFLTLKLTSIYFNSKR